MLISFHDSKIEKICNDPSHAKAKLGKDCADKLYMRLAAFGAAPTLADIRNSPGRCHELTGDLKGYLAVALKEPYRLLFRAAEPVPKKPDGGLDWSKVEALVVCWTENYHGK